VPGATAGFDNDYRAQADACLRSLADRDFFLVHVEATDEAGHQGLAGEKVDALERWDVDIIGPVVGALRASGTPFRVLLLPDHATPCTLRTHTDEPVPYLLFDSERRGPGGTYSEPGVAGSPVVDAHRLMARLVAS
jgi:2,3-bisphosphoglycerate-independent phosphoglycerate mutase